MASTTSRWGDHSRSGSAIRRSCLDRIPDGAIESFAGVGYFFDLAELKRWRAA